MKDKRREEEGREGREGEEREEKGDLAFVVGANIGKREHKTKNELNLLPRKSEKWNFSVLQLSRKLDI